MIAGSSSSGLSTMLRPSRSKQLQQQLQHGRTSSHVARVRRANRPGESPLILGPGGRPSAPTDGRPSPGLIIPGQAPNRAGGGRIVVPGGDKLGGGGGPGGPGLGGGGAGLGLDAAGVPGSGAAGDRPLPNSFRPPPGFMNDAPSVDPSLDAMPADAMLGRLRARAGHWFQLAKLVPALQAKGFDSGAIDEATGITPAEQNLWVVAATVYDSLAASGAPPELLAHFEAGGESRLYHFRFLAVARRLNAAQYIAANALDAPECEALARAMKEWDRRPAERYGFESTAGDCMAFKYLRDVRERGEGGRWGLGRTACLAPVHAACPWLRSTMHNPPPRAPSFI